MDTDAGAAASDVARNDNVNRPWPLLADAQERACAVVAKQGLWTAGQNRGHPAPMGVEVPSPDRIDAAHQRTQEPGPKPVANRL